MRASILILEKRLSRQTKLCPVPAECDLVVVSYTYWQESFDTSEELLAQLPSTLILNLK